MPAKPRQIAQMLADYLAQSGGLSLLPDVISELDLLAKSEGLKDSAVVTTPVALSASELKQIERFVHSKYGSRFRLVAKVDPGLIAGLVIRVGDEVIDSSLSTKLDEIRKELV